MKTSVGKTCKSGHEDVWYVYAERRVCRTCQLERNRRWLATNRDKKRAYARRQAALARAARKAGLLPVIRTYTKDDMMNAAQDFAARCGIEGARAALHSFGAKTVHDVQPRDYPMFVIWCRTAIWPQRYISGSRSITPCTNSAPQDAIPPGRTQEPTMTGRTPTSQQ